MDKNPIVKDAEGNDEEFMTVAMRRFEQSEAAYSEWRRDAKADLRFCSDDQWDDGVRSAREASGRPCLTVDHIAASIRQIVNENRQNRPAIEVDAKGDGADVDTAMVVAGLIRDVEYQSNADIAYDVASEYSVKTGMGYFRLMADYEDSQSFDQVLRVGTVEDPMLVYIDPDHREPDGSDMEWAFIIKDMAKDAYRRRYPDTEMARMSQWTAGSGVSTNWLSKDTIRVAEYFVKEYEDQTIYHVAYFVPNELGKLTFLKEDVVDTKPSDEDIEAQRVHILNKRVSQKITIKWYVLNGKEIISETDFPGEHIPLFPVKGEEFWVDGKRIVMGAVRRAKDAQKIINWMVSQKMEAIDVSNKVPYVGAAGQFDTFEETWRTANQMNYAYLEYNQVDVDGKPAPPPQRQQVETPIGAISATQQSASEDLKTIFGIYDRPEGAQGTETSGVAIIARKEQSSNSSMHFYDNLVRAIKHLGRVMVNCIPTYYDTARTIRIVKPNGDQDMVAINSLLSPENKKFDLTTGRYDVIVKTGPTYQTKRQRLVEQGTALIAQYPAAGPLVADLLVGASDFEGAQEIAARLRTQVPPEVLAATGEDGMTEGDPKTVIQGLQSQLAQGQKSLQALNAHAADVEKKLQDLQEEMKLMKLKAGVDMHKAELTYNIQAQQLKLDEAVAELSFLSQQQKNALAKQQLDLQEKQMSIKAVAVASDMANTAQDREEKYLDMSRDKTIHTISEVKPLPEFDVNGVINDKDFMNNLSEPKI